MATRNGAPKLIETDKIAANASFKMGIESLMQAAYQTFLLRFLDRWRIPYRFETQT